MVPFVFHLNRKNTCERPETVDYKCQINLVVLYALALSTLNLEIRKIEIILEEIILTN